MLSGDNGILQRATDAKTYTGVGQEKETIALAYNSALAKKASNGNSNAVTDSELNDELDNSEATASGNPIIVTFTKSGNVYEIDSNGRIKPNTPKDPNQKDINDLEVGDYVEYGAKLTKESYSTSTSETGYNSSQTFETDTDMLWRVISKSDEKVELVATQNVLANDNATGLYLKGRTGFLNAETVLKNLCETLYNSSYGTSRSINVEDINNLTRYAPETSATNYNKTYTFTSCGPFWKKDENDNESFEIASESNPITVKNNFYYYTIAENIPLYDTLIAESKTYSGDYSETNYPLFYWLGTRCVYIDDGYEYDQYYYLRSVFKGAVSGGELYNVDAYSDSDKDYSCAVRPIVVLNSGIKITDGDGSQATPYKL